MSKIARIYQGTNEIQKYYQGGVLQRLFFDWKHYIGNELNIEYAKECAGRNVVISGKTYQNLVSNLSDLVGKVYTLKNNAKVISNLLRASTTYTFIVSISEANYSFRTGAIIVVNYPTLSTSYISISSQNGIFKIKYTVKEEIPKNILISPHANNDATSSFKLDNLIILEGDYINIDLPNSINGIESVGERKTNNLITEMIDGWCNIATGNIEKCPIDKPNSKISNLIEINPNTKYKSNILSKPIGNTTNTDNLRIRCFDKNKNYVRFSTENAQWCCDFADFYNHKDLYQDIKYIRVLILDSSLEIEDSYVLEDSLERFSHLVTIKNYNYKRETDNIVLPDGTKNSIETIDGKKVHIQRVGKIVLDKSNASNFKQVNNMQVFRWEYFFEIKDFISGLCDKFPIKNVESLINENKGIRLSGTSFRGIDIKFPDNAGFNINTFKTWLSENPITVWYELATPLYTYLESGLYDEITIPTSGIKNEIYSENGKWYHKRNIGKVVFDGSDDEVWEYKDTNNLDRFVCREIQIKAKLYDRRFPAYSEGYHYKSGQIHEDKLLFLFNNSKLIELYVYNYAYTTVNAFKAYLAENPLEVYYELAEPVITELYDITYKLNEPLRSLPNGTCDTIEGNKLIQRVEKIVLDGSSDENWSLRANAESSNFIYFHNSLSTMNKSFTDYTQSKNRMICDKLLVSSNAGDNIAKEQCICGRSAGDGFCIALLKSNLETVDLTGFLKWLSENPVTVYYELKTPIETEITPDMILINGEPITDTVGIELPNGTKDSIENDYYVKRVGKVIFDENIKTYQTLMIVNNNVIIRTRKFSMAIGDGNIISNVTVISWMHDKNNLEEVTETKIMAISSASGWNEANIIIPSSYFEGDITMEVVKEFLAENPVTMYHELMTPIKIPLFSIKEGLTTLKSTNNIAPQIELDCLVRDGFQNMCDNVWEAGNINNSTGNNQDMSGRIRLVNYIYVKPNTKYRLDIVNKVNGNYIGIRYYDSSKVYINYKSIGNIKYSTFTFTIPENCYYIRFIAETTDVNFKIYLKEVF